MQCHTLQIKSRSCVEGSDARSIRERFTYYFRFSQKGEHDYTRVCQVSGGEMI